MKLKLLFSVLFIALVTRDAMAQHSDPGNNTAKLLAYQDSLKEISFQVINKENEPERYNANFKFIKTLVSALKVPHSFNFKFDSLKSISIQTSPDMRFRVFTWPVQNQDGSYRFYGTIQMNNPDGKLRMFPLIDYSAGIKDPADTVTSNEKWFGAEYYQIIPVLHNVRVPYYILLGWKGNTVKTTKKVIEVLYFKNGKAYMGMPVFSGKKDIAQKKRIIFEYSRQVSMMLNYLPEEGMIVFDHLAPPDSKMKDKFDVYGPDLSYDGYKLVNGKWKLAENLILKNPPSPSDNDFNDPKKLKSSPGRKFY